MRVTSFRLSAMERSDVNARAQRELEMLQYINGKGEEHCVQLLSFFGTSGSQPALSKLCVVFPWYDMSFYGLWQARCGLFSLIEAMEMAGDIFEGLELLHHSSILYGNLDFTNLLAQIQKHPPLPLASACV